MTDELEKHELIKCYSKFCAFHSCQVDEELGLHCQLHRCIHHSHQEVLHSNWGGLDHLPEAREGDLVWGLVQRIGKPLTVGVKTWHLTRGKNNE